MVAMATRPDPCAACSEAGCCSTAREMEQEKKKRQRDWVGSSPASHRHFSHAIYPHPSGYAANYQQFTRNHNQNVTVTILTDICKRYPFLYHSQIPNTHSFSSDLCVKHCGVIRKEDSVWAVIITCFVLSISSLHPSNAKKNPTPNRSLFFPLQERDGQLADMTGPDA